MREKQMPARAAKIGSGRGNAATFTPFFEAQLDEEPLFHSDVNGRRSVLPQKKPSELVIGCMDCRRRTDMMAPFREDLSPMQPRRTIEPDDLHGMM
jgi:hypothetical protein